MTTPGSSSWNNEIFIILTASPYGIFKETIGQVCHQNHKDEKQDKRFLSYFTKAQTVEHQNGLMVEIKRVGNNTKKTRNPQCGQLIDQGPWPGEQDEQRRADDC